MSFFFEGENSNDKGLLQISVDVSEIHSFFRMIHLSTVQSVGVVISQRVTLSSINYCQMINDIIANCRELHHDFLMTILNTLYLFLRSKLQLSNTLLLYCFFIFIVRRICTRYARKVRIFCNFMSNPLYHSRPVKSVESVFSSAN